MMSLSAGDVGWQWAICGAGLVPRDSSDAACPSPACLRYTWSNAGVTVGALCLAENLRVGHCYQPGPTGKALEVVDCATATSRGGEVVQRLDNVIDLTRCPLHTTAYAYPLPARTYCVADPRSMRPIDVGQHI